MNLQKLTIAGLGLIVPLGFFLTSPPAIARYACGVNDPRQGRRGVEVVEYYYIPSRSGGGMGCSPKYGGQWHRYYGDPSSGGVWQIAGISLLFRSIYAPYSQIEPAGVIDVLPIRVSR